MTVKVLFHCHTINSKCANINEHDLIKYLDDNGFDCVIITDHNIITKLRWSSGSAVPAAEISTAEGDLIGAFIKDEIPKGLSIRQTSDLIHRQGGIVIAPHPLDKFRREAMGYKTFVNNLQYFDVIESHNSRNLYKKASNRTLRIAAKNKLPIIYGSDAHTLSELGNASINMPKFSNSKEFIEALKDASFIFRSAGIIPHIKTFMIKKT